MTNAVSQALEAIPVVSSQVDASDDYLREVIRDVESALGRLCPSPFGMTFQTDDHKPRYIALCQSARDSRWYITWQAESVGEVPLLSAPRAARAEAFTPISWWTDRGPLAPIEALVILVVEELRRVACSRGAPVEVAQRLQALVAPLKGRARPRRDLPR